MSNLPRNRWISYGLALFIGFVVLVLFSIATVDFSFDLAGMWVLGALWLLLPALSFGSCLYGLFALDKSKESGTTEAVAIVIMLGVFWVYMAYNFFT